jgi:hypothetical protein
MIKADLLTRYPFVRVHHSRKPYVDLTEDDTPAAELPQAWINFLTLVLGSTHSRAVSARLPLEAGQGKHHFDVTQADPNSLKCAQWLWSQMRPDEPFPDLGEMTICLFHSDEKNPSGRFLVRMEDHRVKYRCFHDYSSYALAEVFAVYLGFDVLLKPKWLPLFDTLLQFRAGMLERPDVPYEPLPDPESMMGELFNEYTRRYYDAFIEVLAVRRVRFPDSDTMFDYKFGAKIACIPERAAQVAWQILREMEYAVPSGSPHHYLPKAPVKELVAVCAEA